MAYLVKEIEQAHILWFEASNQWVQFDEQQWLIFCLFEKRLSLKDAAKEISQKLSVPEEQAIATVENIYQSLDKLFNPDFELPDFTRNTREASLYTLPKKKQRSYSYQSKNFIMVYGSPFLEQYIHLPLAHLEVDTADENAFTLEVFPYEDRYAIRINGTEGKCLSAEEPGQIKRLLYIELSNYLYQKDENSWLAFIHGSALRKNDEIIVLTSTGGSGKSTMAGFLILNGFDFFSDDYVPVEAQSKNAYPFPAALCVKNDAIQLLCSKGLKIQTTTSGKMGYARQMQKDIKALPGKIKNVVFIKYCREKEIIFKPISKLEALGLFLEEAWVGNDLKRAEQFMDWFTGLKFYRLEYGNSEKAIEALGKLMD